MEKIVIDLEKVAKYVKPVLENLQIYPSNVEQIFTHENSTGYDIVRVAPIGDVLAVTRVKSTDEEQIVTPNDEFLGFSQVIVDPINLQEKEVNVNAPTNIFVHPDDGYDGLCIVNVIANVDTETKEVTPTKEIQNIERSEGKYIESVTINAIPDNYIEPSGEIDIIENGIHNVREVESVNVEVQPNVASKTITSNGTYNAIDDDLDGYSSVEVETSGVDINDYFNLDYTNSVSSSISNVGYWLNMITKLPKLNTSNIALNGFFRNFKGNEIEGVEDYDTKQKAIMQYTFGGCTGLTSLNLNKWDMSKGTTVNYMFHGCTKLEELLINEWEVSSFIDISSMFYNCSALTSLDLSKWNLTNTSVIDNLFYGCKKLNDLKLPTFNFSKIKSLFMVFHSCSSLTELDIKNWDTSNVTTMNSTFMNCSSLIELDLSGWNTSNVTNMSATFLGCTSLQKLDIRNFDFTKVTSFMNIFGNGTTNYVPANCEIIVKDDTARNWILSKRSDFTNIKTIAEL